MHDCDAQTINNECDAWMMTGCDTWMANEYKAWAISASDTGRVRRIREAETCTYQHNLLGSAQKEEQIWDAHVHVHVPGHYIFQIPTLLWTSLARLWWERMFPQADVPKQTSHTFPIITGLRLIAFRQRRPDENFFPSKNQFTCSGIVNSAPLTRCLHN